MPLKRSFLTASSALACVLAPLLSIESHAACPDPDYTPRLDVPAVSCEIGQPCVLPLDLTLHGIMPEIVKATSGTLTSDKAITCEQCAVETPAGFGNCTFNAGDCKFFVGDAFDLDPMHKFGEGTIALISMTCDEAGLHTLDLSEVTFGAASGLPISGCGQAATIECTDACAGADCSILDDDCNVGVCDTERGTCTAEARAEGTACSDGIACTSPDECSSGACVGGPDICPRGDFCDGGLGACMVSPDSAAWVSLTYDGGIDVSTYNGSSMAVRNDSSNGVEIDRVTLNLSDVILPDIVFDPDGSAGDITAKCLEDGTGSALTGFVAPADPCTDPFSSPFDNGFFVMEMEFTDFDPGETFRFAVDIDPTSIQGATVAGGSGSVSGLELTGAVATVEFSNGTTISGEVFAREGSEGGGEATIRGVAPTAPTIAFVGIPSPPQVVANASQTVRVTGAGANADIRLLQIDGELDLLLTSGHDLDPFEANTAAQVFEYTAMTNGSGQADIPVTLAKDSADAGLNYFRAVVVDGSGRTGENSNVLVLELDASCTQDSDCSDGNPCTDNTCNTGTGQCEVSNNTNSCNDGVFCNGADTCSAGSCSMHAGNPCSGGGECADSCNESGDNCFVASGTSCTDDGNECTDNECDGAGNCAAVNNAEPCNDGLFCNGSDTCSGGTCANHTGDPCAGGTECADGCSETDDDCFVAAGTPCSDDGNSCTDDKCDGAGNCVATDNTSPCDDGDACSTGETCSGGACGGGSSVDCDDGLFCNGTETCDSLSGCLPGQPPLDCSGLDESCAMGACDEGSQTCQSEPTNEGGVCDDADICTTDDECASGSCSGLPLCDPVCDACTGEGACLSRCGHPISDPEGDIVATDALFVLNTAVGVLQCDLCICDVDASGAVVASDALRTLSEASGIDQNIACPGPGQPAMTAAPSDAAESAADGGSR